MLVEALLSLAAIAVVWFFITFYVVPKRLMKHYETTYRNLGYKVFMREFSFMGAPRVEVAL